MIIEAIKSSFLTGSFAIGFSLVLLVLMNHKITLFFQLKLPLILHVLDLGAWARSRLSEDNISQHMCFLLNSSGIRLKAFSSVQIQYEILTSES